jgi:hypothetical protein
VHGAVGLEHDAGIKVGQVGDTEQLTGSGEHRAVRFREEPREGVGHDQAGTRLERAGRSLRSQLEGVPGPDDAAGLDVAIDERTYVVKVDAWPAVSRLTTRSSQTTASRVVRARHISS